MPADNSGQDDNLRLSTPEMIQIIPLSSRPQEDSGPMSLACIVDEIFLSLMNVKQSFCMINANRKRNISNPKRAEEDDRFNSGNGLMRRSYEEQARFKMYRISIFRPPPIFVIQLKHLNETLKKELADLDKETKNFAIKEAIERIYERVDRRFFLLSIKDNDLLYWRLEK